MGDEEEEEDDAASVATPNNNKKPDKTARGLRQFTIQVCHKVQTRGTTSYNQVADELVAEFSDPTSTELTPDQDKKKIQCKGLPRTSVNDMEIEELKRQRLGLRNRIENKTTYLQELEEQFVGLQNLIQQNEQLYGSGNPPSGSISLPFILIQTRPHATVEVEISEDMQLVHYDFNSTPFELHDDNSVLKAMKFCERPQDDNMTHNLTDGGEGSSMSGLCQPQAPSKNLNVSSRPPISPPLPGILKAGVKKEH